MSFANFIKPQLNQKTDDQEWYLRAVTNALNNYMTELETKLSVPSQNVTGTTIVPGTPPVPTPIVGPIAYFIPTIQRFTFMEVKTAMWCGVGETSFINLFNLFGTKFALNFVNLQASPVLEVAGIVTVPTVTFAPMAIQLIATAKGIGAAMTPETFADLESQFLAQAIATIPPIPVPLVGAGIIPPGAFTGVATVSFATAAMG